MWRKGSQRVTRAIKKANVIFDRRANWMKRNTGEEEEELTADWIKRSNKKEKSKICLGPDDCVCLNPPVLQHQLASGPLIFLQEI